MLTKAEIDALQHHPGWEDGRTGYLWCRFDATLDEGRRLRAEVTWSDDADLRDIEGPVNYYDPVLRLESCRPNSPTDPGLASFYFIERKLDEAKAKAMIAADPKRLLVDYADDVADLRIWTEADGWPEPRKPPAPRPSPKRTIVEPDERARVSAMLMREGMRTPAASDPARPASCWAYDGELYDVSQADIVVYDYMEFVAVRRTTRP